MNTATTSTNVVLLDAVRSPFGKAGSLYAGTRLLLLNMAIKE